LAVVNVSVMACILEVRRAQRTRFDAMLLDIDNASAPSHNGHSVGRRR
jgi:hypothetical protein